MGTLFVVGTPIGNLEELSPRALKTLQTVDLIVSEDTRTTQKLLNHFGFKKPLESFFEHNENLKTPRIVGQILAGSDVALVSEAGMPGISDPGYRLIRAATNKGISVIPISGPSAIINALVASGLPTDSFVYAGFLPAKEGKRKNFLDGLKNEKRTIVLYESPHRLIFALKEILEILGDRQICVAREMTKIHEEFFRGLVSQAIEHFGSKGVKGEITLVIGKEE